MKELLQWALGSGLALPQCVLVSSFGRPVCSVAKWVPHSTVLASGAGSVCVPLAKEGGGLGPSSSGLVASRPPLGLGLLRRPGRCNLSPGRFHAGVSPHGRLASCSSGSLPSRVERLVSLQGASDSMTCFSPEGVVLFSGSGIAVRALLLATSLTLTMVLPLTPGWFVRLYLFRMVPCP